MKPDAIGLTTSSSLTGDFAWRHLALLRIMDGPQLESARKGFIATDVYCLWLGKPKESQEQNNDEDKPQWSMHRKRRLDAVTQSGSGENEFCFHPVRHRCYDLSHGRVCG
jgi:hypothetical protein